MMGEERGQGEEMGQGEEKGQRKGGPGVNWGWGGGVNDTA